MPKVRACVQCGGLPPESRFQMIKKKCPAPLCNVCHWKRYGPKCKAARKTPEGREKHTHWNRTKVLTPAWHARQRRHATKRQKLYPEKAKAARMVRAAILKGTLFRPDACSVCMENPGHNRAGVSLIQAHHADYSRPLDVQWLCLPCHAKEHEPSLKSPPTVG